MNNKSTFTAAYLIGMLVVIWMGASFVGSDALALSMIVLIGVVYSCGFAELIHYRQATETLRSALSSAKTPVENLDNWLGRLHKTLQNPVRLRIEGERAGLPLPVFTPYLVGLLVMLGLLGTFAGMVGTLKGAVFALQGTTELQAIREGLAAPMKGLGMAFGTSVAGVAASAMLGLLSTLARRERLNAVKDLDECLPLAFQTYSLNHHRQQTYLALQSQAQTLPEVAERLQSMADQLGNMGDRLSQQLIDNHNKLNQSTATLFKDLATSVDQSLKESLSNSAQLLSENIAPIMQETMAAISQTLQEQSEKTQTQVSSTLADQLQSLAESFSLTSNEVNQAWLEGIKSHSKANSDLIEQVTVQMQSANEGMLTSSSNLIGTLEESQTQFARNLADQDMARLETWSKQLSESHDKLASQFESSTQQLTQDFKSAAESQYESTRSMSETLEQLSETTQNSSTTVMAEVRNLVEQSEALVNARIEAEQHWLENQNSRIQSLTSSLESALSKLREEEAVRGEKAIEQLAKLETKVTTHLEQLGSGLEAPMTRLIETASETPKAAAEVIGQLRSEIANNIERENQLLEERQQIVDSLSKVFDSMEEATSGQREAIDKLVMSSSETLSQVGDRFNTHVDSQVDKLLQIGDHFASSSTDMASLGDAFSQSVKLFGESNQQLMDSLSRIESALEQSSTRSDEQLGYYVAQAKEIIDHSLLSQKEIFDQLDRVSRQAEMG